jgi:hypothetical protein
VFPLEPLSEPLPPPETPSPSSAPPSHTANGEDETSLARLADDGGPPPPEPEAQEVSLTPMPADPVPQPPPPTIAPTPPVAAVAAPPAIAVEALSLEQRVRRLEDALAQLQEQHGIETRIARHPSAPRSAPAPQAPESVPQPAPAPQAVPVSAPASGASAAMLFDVGKRLLGAASNAVTPAPSPSPTTAPPSAGSGVLWLLWDTWAEARAIVRMFLDPRYHLPWSSRLIPLVLLAAILTSKYWVPFASITLIGDLLVNIVDLPLAFLLFKWLGHEARRYRQSSPDLPPNLRL